MSWLTRIRNVIRPHALERDLGDEVRHHLERRAADHESHGIPAGESRRRAAVQFGNQTLVREQSRDQKLCRPLDDAVQDVRYAWRGFLQNPGFALTAFLSLSLAIGANTAIYSLLDALLLRPLPVAQPERLVTLATTGVEDNEAFSYPLWDQLKTAAGDSARIALFDSPNRVEAQIGRDSEAYEELVEQFVSPNAFDTLGVPPAVGRLFSIEEDRFPSPRAVAVLSYEYWRRRFLADPAVVGQTIILHGKALSVIGVAREGFTGAQPGKFVDVWEPVTLMDPGIFPNPTFRPFRLIGRLAPGVEPEQLVQRLRPAFEGGLAESRDSSRSEDTASKLITHSGAAGSSALQRTFSKPLAILLSVGVCILLIACANVASLLLARSVARSGELALRVALGARRSRLVRQLLTESLLLSSLAGVGGWALAKLAAPLLVAMVSKATDPLKLDLSFDVRMLLFCSAICTACPLLFALLPALQATATAPVVGLRHAPGQAGRLRLGRLFVGIQVAFSFCLVIAGTGFLFSLRKLSAVETGFNPTNVKVLTMSNSPQRDRQLAYMQQIQARLSVLPGVQGAATGWMAIFSGARRSDRIIMPGLPPSDQAETFYRVSPRYFATLQTPLVEGRDFSVRDDDTEPVATVVNRAFERRYFRGPALGQEFRRFDGVRHLIVGVAANSRFGDLRGGPEPIAYMPMKPPLGFTLYVRSPLDASTVSQLVNREAAAIGLGLRVRDVTTVQALIGNTIIAERLLAAIGGALAVLGLTLAVVGLFGLLSYAVTQRTREFGIRLALGSPRFSLYRLVLKDVVGILVGGLAVGLAGAMVLMRYANTLLFGVTPADPVVIATAILVFLSAAAAAGGVPARRAVSTDPIDALRH